MEKNVNKRYACLLNGPRSPGMDLSYTIKSAQSPFLLLESSRMRWLAPRPRLLRLCSKGTNQCRIQTLR